MNLNGFGALTILWGSLVLRPERTFSYRLSLSELCISFTLSSNLCQSYYYHSHSQSLHPIGTRFHPPYHPIPSTPDQTPLLINKFTQNHEKFSPALEKHNPALTFASAHLNLKTWTRNMFEHEMELWFSLKLKLFFYVFRKYWRMDWHMLIDILELSQFCNEGLSEHLKKMHQRLEAPSKRDHLFW